MMRQPGEPSVEEILDSIKKVIARDNRADAAMQRNRREAAPAVPLAPETEAEDDDVLDLADSAALAEEEARLAADDLAACEDEDAPAKPLIADDARGSMRDSLAALAMLAQPGVPPQIVRSGETSLEALVRDLLRPALSDWLSQNLPQIVDKMVADEIARIVGKKG